MLRARSLSKPADIEQHPTLLRGWSICSPLIHKQAIVVDVVLLDKLGKLIRFLRKVERVQVHYLVPGPTFVSNDHMNFHERAYLG